MSLCSDCSQQQLSGSAVTPSKGESGVGGGGGKDVEFVRAQPDLVTKREHLDRLASLYSLFIVGECFTTVH